MIHKNRLEEIRIKLGFEGLFDVSNVGQKGGLALLWRKKHMATLLSYSQNHIDISITLEDVPGYRLTGFYGFPKRNRRRESWNFLRHLAIQSHLPWCCIGDFNDLLSISEKKKGNSDHRAWLLSGYRETIDDCGLIDLGMSGYQFTWERGRGSINWVEERLDRGFATQNWCALFPNFRVLNLVASYSDHSPIFLELGGIYRIKKIRKFHFENSCLLEKDCKRVVEMGWNRGIQGNLQGRIETCGTDLFKWGDMLRNSFQTRINEAKKKTSLYRGEEIQFRLRNFELLKISIIPYLRKRRIIGSSEQNYYG
ncbi:hypothetical protein DH2020_017455 [Rehmannia glutinosa]|uniref:Endonuclease/exonuclease/phosphatase domain-containing protein n=1 Tax=Rehmannia glutinosa TaxID=99300 RepID=A0ABR0WRT5_REHGL